MFFGFLRQDFGLELSSQKWEQSQLQQIPKLQTRNELGVARYNAGLVVLPLPLATPPITAAETREWLL